MNDTLKLWLTPEGVTVALAGLVAIGWLVVRGLRGLGKHEAADTVQALLVRAETAEKVLGSVMTGVQKFKVSSPKEAAPLIETLRATNKAAGVEEIVAPIVKTLAEQPTEPAEKLVRRETGKIARRVS